MWLWKLKRDLGEKGDDYLTSWVELKYYDRNLIHQVKSQCFASSKQYLAFLLSSGLGKCVVTNIDCSPKNLEKESSIIKVNPSSPPIALQKESVCAMAMKKLATTNCDSVLLAKLAKYDVQDDISVASTEKSSLTSCLHIDDFNKPTSEDMDNTLTGFSLTSKEVQRNGNPANRNGQRSNIFQSECKIQDKVCK